MAAKEEAVMNDLLDYLVQAHGGLKRWNELDSVSAHLIQGGVTWEMKGQKGACSTTSRRDHIRVAAIPFSLAIGLS
jgi:hypothetical protein